MKCPDLCIPVEALDQHTVVLGKTGAGKSSVLRYLVEYLLGEKKRVVIIDPKGDWWGLKASRDGKGPGHAVITFGNFKDEEATDVPINAQSGKHVAELISSGNRPAIIGFRGWMTAHMVQFWIDFASTLFNENEGELYLVVDEVHNFAPKGKVMDPQAGKCLHWTNRLMSEGRGLGIVALIASQRPQKVHNDTLTSCETLIAMRVIHAADRGAIDDWIKGCGDPKQGKMVLENLANLSRGNAFVWSPEVKFGPTLLEFPMFETFDSFAPPQIQKKVSRRTWADVDLGEVTEKLAAVIEESKANDPKELKQKIGELERGIAVAQRAYGDEIAGLRRQLEAKPSQTVPALKEADFKRLEKLEGHLESELMLLRQKLSEIKSPAASTIRETSPISLGRPKEEAGKVHPEANGKLAPRHQEIINAIAFYNEIGVARCDKKRIAGFVTRPFNGNFRTDLSVLRTAGLIEYPTPGDVVLTELGRCGVTKLPTIRTQGDLHRLWIEKLAPRHAEILGSLLALKRGVKCEKTALAATVSREFNGNFRTDLSVLRTLGTIDYPSPGTVCVSDNLYPPIPA